MHVCSDFYFFSIPATVDLIAMTIILTSLVAFYGVPCGVHKSVGRRPS